jgi:hypothetical protein
MSSVISTVFVCWTLLVLFLFVIKLFRNYGADLISSQIRAEQLFLLTYLIRNFWSDVCPEGRPKVVREGNLCLKGFWNCYIYDVVHHNSVTNFVCMAPNTLSGIHIMYCQIISYFINNESERMRKEAVVAKFEEPVWLEELKNTARYVRVGSFSCWDLSHGYFGYEAGVTAIQLINLVKLFKLTQHTG